MGLFGKKEVDEFNVLLDDRLVVIDTEQRTSEIVYLDEITDTHVQATGRYVVPKEECEVTTSPEGRVWIVKANTHIITELQRIAKLEQSIVLKQLTNYKPPVVDNPNMDMKFWGLAALLFVAIIVAAF